MNRHDVHLKAREVAPVGLWSLRAGAPTVATVVSLNHPGLAPDTRDLVRRFTRAALQCLVNTGARPVLVDSSARQLPAPAVTAAADAVLVLGDGDADPALCGGEGPAPHGYGTDRRADLHTLDLLRRTLDRDIPLLAVGVQRHPEDSCGSAADRGRLFSAFVEQAGAGRRRAPKPQVLVA